VLSSFVSRVGLRWLKIRLANMWGADKLSLDERVRFTDERLDKVAAAADNPLEPENLWWSEGETPWQVWHLHTLLARATVR